MPTSMNGQSEKVPSYKEQVESWSQRIIDRLYELEDGVDVNAMEALVKKAATEMIEDPRQMPEYFFWGKLRVASHGALKEMDAEKFIALTKSVQDPSSAPAPVNPVASVPEHASDDAVEANESVEQDPAQFEGEYLQYVDDLKGRVRQRELIEFESDDGKGELWICLGADPEDMEMGVFGRVDAHGTKHYHRQRLSDFAENTETASEEDDAHRSAVAEPPAAIEIVAQSASEGTAPAPHEAIKTPADRLNALKSAIDEEMKTKDELERSKKSRQLTKGEQQQLNQLRRDLQRHNEEARDLAIEIIGRDAFFGAIKSSDEDARKLYDQKVGRKVTKEERLAKEKASGLSAEQIDVSFEARRRRTAFIAALTDKNVNRDIAGHLYAEAQENARELELLRANIEAQGKEALTKPWARRALAWHGIAATDVAEVTKTIEPIISEYRSLPKREPRKEVTSKERVTVTQRIIDGISAGQEIPDSTLRSVIKDAGTSAEDKTRLETVLKERKEKRRIEAEAQRTQYRDHIVSVISGFKEGDTPPSAGALLEFKDIPEVAQFITAHPEFAKEEKKATKQLPPIKVIADIIDAAGPGRDRGTAAEDEGEIRQAVVTPPPVVKPVAQAESVTTKEVSATQSIPESELPPRVPEVVSRRPAKEIIKEVRGFKTGQRVLYQGEGMSAAEERTIRDFSLDEEYVYFREGFLSGTKSAVPVEHIRPLDATQKESIPAAPAELNAEAKEVLAKVGDGGIPLYWTENLKRIFTENHVRFDPNEPPRVAIARMQEIADAAAAPQAVTPEASAEEQASKVNPAPNEEPVIDMDIGVPRLKSEDELPAVFRKNRPPRPTDVVDEGTVREVPRSQETFTLDPDVVRMFHEKFGLGEDSLRNLPTFTGLSRGQQMLVLRNMEQLTLASVQKDAKELQKKEWANTGAIKKGIAMFFTLGMKPEIRIAELEKELLAKARDTRGDGDIETWAEKLTNIERLAKVAGSGPDVVIAPSGELEVAYVVEGDLPKFSAEQGITPEHESLLREFNAAAADFSRLPHEWRYETEENKTNRKRWMEASVRYEKARGTLFELFLRANARELSPSATEDEILRAHKSALETVRAVDERIALEQLFNRHPDAEDALQNIEDQSVIAAGAKEFLKSKGMFIAGGFLARAATVAISGGIMLPAIGLIGAGVGAGIGRKEGRTLMRERRVEGRLGDDDLREVVTTRDKNGDIILGADGKPLERQLKEFTDATFFVDRIDRLSEKFELATKPEERAMLEQKIAKTLALMAEKLDRGMINFAGSSLEAGDVRKGDTIANRLSFIEALGRGKLLCTVDQGQLEEEIRRLVSNVGKRQEKIEDARLEEIRKIAAKSALVRGSFALAGASIAEGLKQIIHFGEPGYLGAAPTVSTAEQVSLNARPIPDVVEQPPTPATVPESYEDHGPDADVSRLFTSENFDANIPKVIGRDLSTEEIAALRSTGGIDDPVTANMDQHNALVDAMKRSPSPLSSEAIEAIKSGQPIAPLTGAPIPQELAEYQRSAQEFFGRPLSLDEAEALYRVEPADGSAVSPDTPAGKARAALVQALTEGKRLSSDDIAKIWGESGFDPNAMGNKIPEGVKPGISVDEWMEPSPNVAPDGVTLNNWQEPGPTDSVSALYKVAQGDNLTKILRANIAELQGLPREAQENAIQNLLKSLSQEELRSLGLSDPNVLKVGQTIDLERISELFREKQVGGEDLFTRAQRLAEQLGGGPRSELTNNPMVNAPTPDIAAHAEGTISLNETRELWGTLSEQTKYSQAHMEASRYISGDMEALFPKPVLAPVSPEWLSLRDRDALSIFEQDKGADPHTFYMGTGELPKGYEWSVVEKLKKYLEAQGITAARGYVPIRGESLSEFLERAYAEKIMREGPTRPFVARTILREA